MSSVFAPYVDNKDLRLSASTALIAPRAPKETHRQMVGGEVLRHALHVLLLLLASPFASESLNWPG